MEVYVINNAEEFHGIYGRFKKSARVGSVPDTFLIGFDVEKISRANHSESFVNVGNWICIVECDTACCLIQLATDSMVLICNLVKIGHPIPRKLLDIVSNGSWIKVGVGIDQDLANLSDNYNMRHCEGGIELRNIALMAKISKPNLENLYSHMLGKHIQKKTSICDWTQELTQDQLECAAKDAIMSYQLGKTILTPAIDAIKNSVHDAMNFEFIGDIEYKTTATDDNWVGQLNEIAQKRCIDMPVYISSEHLNGFKYECSFDFDCTEGIGKSKKEAKRDAAQKMIELKNTA